MAPRTLWFLCVFAVLVGTLATLAVVYALRLRRLNSTTLESLLERLRPFDRQVLALIAADLHDASGTATGPYEDPFEPSRIWDLIGGMDGLEHMEANCAVLIDVTSLLQQRYPEALVVAEELRLRAREIQWHLERLRGAARLGKVESVFEEYAQRAIASYYSMTQRVLALYAWGDSSGHAQLLRVI